MTQPGKGATEREFKFRLDGEQAVAALIQAAGAIAPPPVRQMNTYFDTTGLDLGRQGHLVRLREEAGRFFMTIKGPERQGQAEGLLSRSEEEVEVGADEARKVLAGDASPLSPFEPGEQGNPDDDARQRLR